MAHIEVVQMQQALPANRKVAKGLLAVFITQFVSFLFINARNIAQPEIIAEFDGIALFSWLIALPALFGAASTLLFGKLSDIYGRRSMLMLSISIFLIGLGITSTSTNMIFIIVATIFMSIGHFPIVALCFSVIGDLFVSAERAKWTGLLNLPSGIAALIGPVLGGIITESALGWRGLYWGTIPLMLIAILLVFKGIPNNVEVIKPKIDVAGTLVMILATSTLIIGFSWLGEPQKLWFGLGLLAISSAAWIAFITIENKADAPILDPQIFRNRTFMTAATAAFLSFFGMLGIMAYSPIFVQSVMNINPSISGSMLTPYATLVALLGIPAGFLLAKTKKYKWLYLIGYSIVTLAMFAIWQFTAHTPIWLYVLITSVAGLGLGVVPTINTLVAQYAVPKHLMGVAIGAIFFFQMIGIAVAPAILGLAQNSASDLESGLKLIFLVGAITMTIALLLITTIPEISMDTNKLE
ncbi:MAG: MFS transporter [Anaerolineaceae bacterium]|nr:MFS transporter [Anaerolineaceae bacterium]